MRQPENRQRGAAGATLAKYFFERLGWGVVETGDHDLGTDLSIQIRDSSLRDMALMFGAQVKTGDEYFREPGVINEQSGWFYRESDQRHANYWSNHPLPHIIVLQSENQTRRVWAWVNRDTIQNTGQGWKVFVPETQKLSAEFEHVWIAEAERALKRVVLDGSRWNFQVSTVASAHRARFALLAAHLVAPHPNKGSPAIGWEEALSLCVLASADRWEAAAAKHDLVPTIAEAASHPEWGWRFAAAVQKWVYDGDVSLLDNLQNGDQIVAWRIAHEIVRSVALRDSGRARDITESLASLIVEGEYSADQAWLLVHLAYDSAELGRLDQAHLEAEEATVRLTPVASDVTASAIRAAAAWMVFETRSMISTDLSTVVAALDTPTSWWRTQQTATALEVAAKRQFDAWSADQSVTLGAADVPHNELFSAALQARLAGSYSQARRLDSLQATVNLSTKRPVPRRPHGDLSTLLKAGDEKSIRGAVRTIARRGPLSDLRELVDEVSLAAATRSNSRAVLRLLQDAGTFATPDMAEKHIAGLLEALEDPDSFTKRVSARYFVIPALLEALSGLAEFLGAEHWHRVVNLLLEWAKRPDELIRVALHRLLTVASLDQSDLKALADELPEEPAWLRQIFLVALGPNHPLARAEATSSLLEGDMDGLQLLRRYDELQPEEVDALARHLKSRVKAYGQEPLSAGIAIGSEDYAGHLAGLSVNFPDQGGWRELVDFFADVTVRKSIKREAALVLTRNIADIPEEHLEPLRLALDLARSAHESTPGITLGLEKEAGGSLDCLWIALSRDEPLAAEAALLRLLAGDSLQRADAVAYLARASDEARSLVALTNDPDPEVANEAVVGLARAVFARGGPSPALVDLLKALAGQDRMTGLYVVVGLSSGDVLPAAVAPVIEILENHASARVRRMAHALPSEDLGPARPGAEIA